MPEGVGSNNNFNEYFDRLILETNSKGRNFTLAFIDFDDFKAINDKHGHDVGDMVISAVVEKLKNGISERGSLFRNGGDEFSILFPETEKEETFLLLENIRKDISNIKDVSVEEKKTPVSPKVSIGIASFPDDGSRRQDVCRMADDALYRKKKRGRNMVCLSKEEKKVTKTSHYTQGQLERLSHLAKEEAVGEAVLLREALDDLLKKYDL